jgi:hypothetical protein
MEMMHESIAWRQDVQVASNDEEHPTTQLVLQLQLPTQAASGWHCPPEKLPLV